MNDDAFQDLLRRVRAGDEQAWACWVDRFEPIIRLAGGVGPDRRILRPQRDTDDNVQSVFLRCLVEDWAGGKNWQTFEDAVCYFRRATVNRVLMHLRRLRAQCRDVSRQAPFDAGLEAADPAQPPPDEQAAAREEGERLLRVVRLACRDEGQFEITCRLLDGEGYAAVARDLGVTADSVRKQHERVLKRVEDHLRGCQS